MKHPHIVFDLDGTLVESLPGIALGINQALKRMEKPQQSEANIRNMIGQGAAHLCAQALGYRDTPEAAPEEISCLLELFKQEYLTSWQGNGTRAYPGTISMMMRLCATGAKIAILSNKPMEHTQAIVRKIFSNLPIDPILGYQKGSFPRKPDPSALLYVAEQWGVEPKELMLVGDSIHDAQTAKNAGSQLVLVPWGYALLEQLLEWRREEGSPIVGSMEGLTQFLLTGKTRIQTRH